MFTSKNIINSLGILLTIIGVYIVYINSPLNSHEIDGGNASTDFTAEDIEMNKRNKKMKYGIFLIIFGSLLQLLSNFIPTNT